MVNKPPFSYDSSRGSVKIISSERHMQMYDLTKNEVSAISAWNTLATVVFSVASFFLSQSVSILIGVMTKEEAQRTTLETYLCTYGFWFSLIISLMCFVIGAYLLGGRTSILAVVENETKIPEESNAQGGSKAGKAKGVHKKQRP